MKVSVHQQTDIFEQLKPEWNLLLHRSAADTIFNTWEWHSTWWSAYEPGELYVVTLRDENTKLLGIASWFIGQHEEAGRVLQGIGCVDVTDYLDIIADRDHVDAVYAALAEHLSVHSGCFDLFDICNIPQESPTLATFVGHLRNNGFDVSITQQEVCPVIALPNDFEAYLDSLNKKQRHEVRRKQRRIEGEADHLERYVVGPEHHLDEELERFLVLMRSSDPKKDEFLKDTRNMAFFKAIMPIFFEKGWLQLNFLMINHRPVASYLNFDYGDRIMVYNSGLEMEPYGYLSPGNVLLAYNIEEAIQQGKKFFDFLRGNEAYKYRMGGQDSAVFQIEARLGTLSRNPS